MATRERLAAIDTLAVRELAPLWEVVIDPAIEVVMHAASEDLRICRFQTGRVPRRVFDVQIAAGLARSSATRCRLATCWHRPMRVGGARGRDPDRLGGARPLSAPQLRYALDDVRYLLDLADLLSVQLVDWGRTSWAESEFTREFGGRDPEPRRGGPLAAAAGAAPA